MTAAQAGHSLPIVRKLSINVNVTFKTGDSVQVDRHQNVGNIVEENNGTLKVEDRYGLAVTKYDEGIWVKYDIITYSIPGDHEEVE